MANLKIKSVNKSFDKIHALKNVDIEVKDGEFFVLLGKTGAGKTTLLRIASGLDDQDSGEVFIDNKPMEGVSPSDRNVTFVFQQYSLYPHLSVYDNLAFPLRSPKVKADKKTIEEKIQKVSKLLRIDHKLSNKATALSGGEMQRVAIGRALVREPLLYFMDEPLSSLDAKLRSELRIELKRVQTELGATILYVTHDQIEAMTLADRIGVMREGELLQIGTPKEIYEHPVNEYVASKLGSPPINLIPIDTLGESDMTYPEGAKTIGIRTENTSINKTSDSNFQVTIRRVEHLGDQSYLHLTLDSHELIILADPHLPYKEGEQLYIDFINPIFFDENGDAIRQ